MNVFVTKLKLWAEIIPFLEWNNKAKSETQQGINKIPHPMELRQVLWSSQTANIFLVWERKVIWQLQQLIPLKKKKNDKYALIVKYLI